MTDTAKILVVDDEADLRDMVREYLELQGFDVDQAGDAIEARAKLAANPADLVILDVDMPGEDGLSLARSLREAGPLGIIMLTAAGEVVDRIVGIEMGADDYIPKPFDLREMLARVKAVLRRTRAASKIEGKVEDTSEAQDEVQSGGEDKVTVNGETVSFGACRLDLAGHKLYGPEGDDIAITAMEFDLLRAFAEHPNRVLNRDQLLEMAHNRYWEPFDRSIDIRIARIRRKIETDASKPQVIKTVRGVGYLYSTEGR